MLLAATFGNMNLELEEWLSGILSHGCKTEMGELCSQCLSLALIKSFNI